MFFSRPYLWNYLRIILKKLHTKQTRDIDQVLVQCWVDVLVGEPILSQHWVHLLSHTYYLGHVTLRNVKRGHSM